MVCWFFFWFVFVCVCGFVCFVFFVLFWFFALLAVSQNLGEDWTPLILSQIQGGRNYYSHGSERRRCPVLLPDSYRRKKNRGSVCVCVSKCVYLCFSVCVCLCAHMQECMWLCMCVSLYVDWLLWNSLGDEDYWIRQDHFH